jgi:hypothetical protein
VTTRRNPWLILIVGSFGVMAGLALIFANLPIGRALIIASTIGAALALTHRDRAQDGEAWFGRKRFGFGWTVRSWQGAALIALAVAALFFLSLLLARP